MTNMEYWLDKIVEMNPQIIVCKDIEEMGVRMNYFTEARQNYIGELLKAKGSISRSEIMGQFKVGEATATRDLTAYRKANPALIYDVTKKRYVLEIKELLEVSND